MTFYFKEIFTIMSVLYCSIIPPPNPVATVAAYEDNRHGETVHSEAGVSDSAETRCRDTGIQLAAGQTDVPGIVLQTAVASSMLVTVLAQQHRCWALITCQSAAVVMHTLCTEQLACPTKTCSQTCSVFAAHTGRV